MVLMARPLPSISLDAWTVIKVMAYTTAISLQSYIPKKKSEANKENSAKRDPFRIPR